MNTRRIGVIILVVCLLGSTGVATATTLQPEDFAVYSREGISLAGSSVVTGNVATGNGVVNLTAVDHTNKILGDIYTRVPATITCVNDTQYGEVILSPELTFPSDIPAMPDPPEIENQGGAKAFNEWSYPTAVTVDTQYTSITVNGLMVVDVQSSDRVIRTGTMTLNGGRIILKGSGRLFLFIDNTLTINGWVPINQPESAYNCPGTSDNLHVFLSNGNFVLNTGAPINGSIYVIEGMANLQAGGATIKGNLVVGGATAAIRNNAKVEGVVYAPNADVAMGSSGRIDGYLVCKSLTALGSVRVNYAECTLSIPDLPEPPGPSPFVHGLIGEYYDTLNPTKASYKRMVRVDPAVEFNWQQGSPDDTIGPDTFSVRWTGFVEVPSDGTYVFHAYSDDGVKLSIDGETIIDRWSYVNLEFTDSEPIALEAGTKYPFEMEYCEGPLNSTVFLFWESESQQLSLVPSTAFWIDEDDYDDYATTVYVNTLRATGDGLRGEYFVGADGLSGQNPPAKTVDGEMIFHDWGAGSPGGGVPDDDFSARWTGYIEAKYTEDYVLDITVDDRVRVWINDELELDAWVPNSSVTYSIPVTMQAGSFTKIKIEYSELTGGATCLLYWRSDGQEQEIIPVRYLYATLP